MKILHLIDSFSIGGAEKLVYNHLIYENEKNSQNENYVMTLYTKDNFLTEGLLNKNIKIYNLKCKFKYDFTKIYKIVKYIKNEKIDIVHVHLFPANYFSAISSLFLKDVKFIYTEHNTTNRRRKYKILSYIEKLVYKRFDKLICCSSNVKDELINWIDYNNEKIEVVNNGIPNNYKSNNTKKKYDFILVGSMRSNAKGIDIFLNAISKVKDDIDKVAILGDGKKRHELEILAKKIGVKEKVDFLGNRENVLEYLYNSKIFVCSSRWEGLPLVLLEAMSCEMPIITSNVGEIGKIINETNGILIQAEDINLLAQKMIYILKDYKLQKQLGHQAKKDFNEKFDISIYCNYINKIYKDIIFEV